MVLFQALFGLIARSAGKILNTAFGWATVMLFGKVRPDRQIYLSIISFGSVLWIVALLGIAFPAFGTWLLTFARPPHWLNHNWIRLIMLGIAVAIPLVIGALSSKASGAGEQAQERRLSIFVSMAKGYPYTFGMAVTLIMMTAFAPLLKLRTMMRRWTNQHMPVIVRSEDYPDLVQLARKALAAAGWATEEQPASWMLQVPTRLLAALSGGAMKQMMAKKLTRLACDRLEVELHPSDLILSGRPLDVGHARAILAEELAFSPAYQTWDEAANKVEDALRGVHEELERGALSSGAALGRLAVLEHDTRSLDIPYEEWEVLFRLLLLAERNALRVTGGLTPTGRLAPNAPPPNRPWAPRRQARGTGRRVAALAALAAATAVGLAAGRER